MAYGRGGAGNIAQAQEVQERKASTTVRSIPICLVQCPACCRESPLLFRMTARPDFFCVGCRSPEAQRRRRLSTHTKHILPDTAVRLQRPRRRRELVLALRPLCTGDVRLLHHRVVLGNIARIRDWEHSGTIWRWGVGAAHCACGTWWGGEFCVGEQRCR